VSHKFNKDPATRADRCRGRDSNPYAPEGTRFKS